MKVMIIVGARLQFIKAAVISRAFGEHRPDVQEIIVHTGQHYDVNMSDVFFEELDIPLHDYNLRIEGGSHGDNTGRMIEKLESLMIWMIEPVGYLEMAWLEANCRCVATDSGGVQKEAYFHGNLCVTLRPKTEWVELVRVGWNLLVGHSSSEIKRAIASSDLIVAPSKCLYGIGASASLIVNLLEAPQ